MTKLESYLTGFILSAMLTLAAFIAVVNHTSNALVIILLLAIVQLFIQLFFFLHLGKGADKNWNLIILISSFSIILILVVGSIWIMNHLNYNMTPQQMNDLMMKSEGMEK